MAQEIRRRTNADQILNILSNDRLLPKGNDLLVIKNGKSEVIQCKNRIHKLFLKIINLINPNATFYSEGAIGRKVKNTIKELNKEFGNLDKIIANERGLESVETLLTILETFKENNTKIKMIKIWAEKYNNPGKYNNKEVEKINKELKKINEFKFYINEIVGEKSKHYENQMNFNDKNTLSPKEALRFLHAYNELQFFKVVLEKAPEALFDARQDVEHQKNLFNQLVKKADEKYEKIKETADSKTRELIDTAYQITDKLKASKLTFEEAEKSSFKAFDVFAEAWEHEDVKKYLNESVINGFSNTDDTSQVLKQVVGMLGETNLNTRRDFLANPELKESIDKIKLKVDTDCAAILLSEKKLADKILKLNNLKDENKAENNENKLPIVKNELEQLLIEGGFLSDRFVVHEGGAVEKQEVLDADPHTLTKEQVGLKSADLIKRSLEATPDERAKIQDQLRQMLTKKDSILAKIRERDQLQAKVEKLARTQRKVDELMQTVESNASKKVGLEPFVQMLTQVQQLILFAIDAQEKDGIYQVLFDERSDLEKQLKDSINEAEGWNEVKLTAGNTPVKIG